MHPARVPSQDEVLQVFRKAGFSTLSPFQEKLIPAILKGKDVAAESVPGSGKTVGFILPLILGLRGAGLAPRAVILAPTSEEVAKIARAYTRIARFVRDAPAFVPLGEIEDARREQRRLEKGATIVAGTVERVIDHIRRGSLGFEQLQTIIVEEPEGDARADFVKDVHFIFAKIADRRQTILFSRSPLTEDNELLKLLRHPVILETGPSTGSTSPHAGHVFLPTEGTVRVELLARIILAQRVPSALVYHSPRADARRIAEALQPRGLRVGLVAAGGGSGSTAARLQADRRKPVEAFSRGELDVLLVPLSSSAQPAPGLEDLTPTHVVFFDFPPVGNRQSAGVRKGAVIVALMDRGQEKELARLEEAIGVTINKGEIPSNEEVLTGAIDRMLRRMKSEDPAELAALRARIRKQVPLLLRPRFMASLLKSQLPPGTGLFPGTAEAAAGAPSPRTAGAQQPSRTPAGPPETTRVPRTAGSPETARAPRGRFGRNVENTSTAGSRTGRSIETQPGMDRSVRQHEGPRPGKGDAGGEGFTQLFISIGRNRRVFARDLTELFTEKLQLQAGDIGGVRVFEKYSFVDIVPGKAGEAITRLSGSEVKGRTITVNYAKKKEEKEGK